MERLQNHFLFFLTFLKTMCIWHGTGYVYMKSEVQAPPGAGVTGGGELPSIGAGN